MHRAVAPFFVLLQIISLLPANEIDSHGAEAEHSAKPATLLLDLVDEATGEAVPSGWAVLYPCGETRTYRNEIRPDRAKRDSVLRFEVSPGEYGVLAQRRAGSIDGLQFEAVDPPEKIALSPGEQKSVTIKLRARPLTPEEIDARAPMVAMGRVVDSEGKPLADVEVRVATGWGTLLGGGSARTDYQGEYVLRFGAGISIGNSKSQLQAAQFVVADDRYVEVSRSHEFHRMAYELDADSDGEERDQVVLKGTPARLDFVLSEPATVELRFVDKLGRATPPLPVELKGSSKDRFDYRYMRSIKPSPSDQPATVRWEAAPGRRWQFASEAARSPAITFPEPGRYVVTLRRHPATEDDAEWLEIVDVEQTSRLPLDAVVSDDDPFARPPLSGIERRAAEKLIKKIGAANERWLNGPPAELGEFSYRFVLHPWGGRNERRSDEVAVKAGERQHGKHQGVSYHSAIHRLLADPGNVIIRSFDVGPERTTIAYTFRKPVGQAMGTGVAGSWAGYFSRQTVNGTLVVDSKRPVPIEWFDDASRESYSDFIEVSPGQFVPTRIEIAKSGAPLFDWRFDWHPEGLWLFREGRDVDSGDVVASIEDVRFSGENTQPKGAASDKDQSDAD